MINDLTANYSFQLPNTANTLAEDLPRLRSAFNAIDTQFHAVSVQFTGVPVFADLTALSATLNGTITSTAATLNGNITTATNNLRAEVPTLQNHALNVALGVI